MGNPFVHCELSTTSVPKAKAFYAKLFKWKLNEMKTPNPAGKYTLIEVGGEDTGGGIMQQCIPDAPSAWMPYVFVKDIDAYTKQAKKLRAKILKDVTEVPGMGWLSILEDPTGAMIGLWEPMNK